MRIILISILVLSFVSVRAQVDWQRIYGDEPYTSGVGVIEIENGDFIFLLNKAAESGNNRICLMCTDSNGVIRWEKKVTDTAIFKANGFERTPDRGYIIAGTVYSDEVSYYDACLIRTDSLGEAQWVRRFGGNDWDFAYTVLAAPDTTFILAGETYSYGSGESDIYVVKTNGMGDSLWSKTFGGDSADFGSAITLAPDSNYLLACNTKSYGRGDMDAWILKLGKDGDEKWSAIYGDTLEDRVYAIRCVPDKGFVFTGSTRSYGSQQRDVWLMRFDSGANLMWRLPQPWTIGSGDEYSTWIELNASGDFVYSGCLTGPLVGSVDYFITVMGDYFNYKAGNTFGFLGDEYASMGIPTSDSGYLIIGQSSSDEGPSNINAYAVKMGADCVSPDQPVYTTALPEELQVMQSGCFEIYPLPCHDLLFIQPQAEDIHGSVSATVYDMSGRLMMVQEFTETDKQSILALKTDFCKPGVYILELTYGNQRVRSRFIKQ